MHVTKQVSLLPSFEVKAVVAKIEAFYWRVTTKQEESSVKLALIHFHHLLRRRADTVLQIW